jgi:hypothetical protein
MVKNSPVVRRLVSQGHILLLDPEKVDKKKRPRSLKTAYSTSEEMNEEVAADVVAEDLDIVDASPKVAMWVDSVNQGTKKPTEFLSEMNNDKDVLTEKDFSYISRSLRKYADVVQWAMDGLAELKEKAGTLADESSSLDEEEPIAGGEENVEAVHEELSMRTKIHTGHSSEGSRQVLGSDGLSDDERRALRHAMKEKKRREHGG